MKKFVIALMLGGVVVSTTSCYGSYTMTGKYHEWSKNLGGWDTMGGKFITNLWMYTIGSLPYIVTFAADGLVLNTIEFWSGNNPLAMKEGQKNIKMVKENGKKYKVTTERHKVTIEVKQGENEGDVLVMNYVENEKTWYAQKNEEEAFKVATYEDGFNHVQVYDLNGNTIQIDMTQPYDQQLVQKQIVNQQGGMALCH